jgi:hypothetical protein
MVSALVRIRTTSKGRGFRVGMTLCGLISCRNMANNHFMYLWEEEISYTATRMCLCIPIILDNHASPLTVRLTREPEMQEWLLAKSSLKKNFPLTPAITSCIDRFFFNHYCSSFRRGAFARANSSMYVAQIILNITITCYSHHRFPQSNVEYVW